MSKLYVWVNSKISPLQKGIQAAHVIPELVNVYMLDLSSDESSREEFINWVRQGKVIVVLEGGTHYDLSSLYDMFTSMPDDDHYPFEQFCESDLKYSVTAVGIVLDEQWDQANRSALSQSGSLNDWEQQLLNKLMLSREAW